MHPLPIIYSLLFTLLACLGGPLHAAEKVSPPDSWHLFLDDSHIDSISGLQRHAAQPSKLAQPVLIAEHPWETNPYLFGTVLYDEEEGVFKMWYMSYNHGEPYETQTYVLYAESDDGITWRKPELHLHDFKGSKANNIVLPSLGQGAIYSPSVIKDTREKDPFKRYKMVFWDKKGPQTYGDGGMFTAYSPDGKNWKRAGSDPVLYASREENSISDVLDLLQDPTTGKYVVYAKGWSGPKQQYRMIVRSESDDFKTWSEPTPVLRHAFDKNDPQSYGMPVFHSGGMFIGLLRSYKHPGAEDIDIQLATSRDGLEWTRALDMQPFLPLGPEGHWDDGMLFTAPAITKDGTTYIYYGGWDGPHNSKNRKSAVGLATMKEGRFAAMRPVEKTGKLVTVPVLITGNHLLVNADATHGAIKAALLDENGNEIDGYGLADALPIQGDGIAQVAAWKNGASLASLTEKPIRIKFELNKGAKLFAFRFGEK